jgi:predicted esterase YcpF (UPF0227 family)
MNLYTYLENALVNKTVILYHGLGSNPASDKKKYLNKIGTSLKQDHHDYQKEYDLDRGKSFMIEQQTKANGYNVIMGISFGGYVAYMLACRLQKPLILINPAINRSVTKTKIGEYNYEYQNMKPLEIEYFHGEKDTSVRFEDNKKMVPNDITTTFHEIAGMEHRVPISFFKKICQQSQILK